MPTQEEIDNYNSIKADGTLATLPIATQLKIADRFNDRLTVKTNSFEVPNSGGVIKETTKTIRANNERNTGFIEKDQTPGLSNLFGLIGPDREDLSQPIEETRTFIPDVRNIENKRTGAITQETGFNPLAESFKETLSENMTAMSRSTGIPFLLEQSGIVKNFNQEFAGLTDKEYEEIPALQKLGASIPADIATGEVLGGAVRAISKIPIMGKTLGHMVKGQVPHATKEGRRLLTFQEKFHTRQKLIATETLEDFVKREGGLTKDVAKKALEEGFPINGATIQSLKRGLKVNKASLDAGQKGMKRRYGMSQEEMSALTSKRKAVKDPIKEAYGMTREDLEQTVGAKLSVEMTPLKTPVGTLSGESVERTINETAEEILAKHGSGTPKMFEFKAPNPAELTGGAPTKKYAGNLNLWNLDADENTKGFLQQVIDTNPDLQMKGRVLGDAPFSRNLALQAGEELGLTLDDAALREMGQMWNNVEVETYKGQLKNLILDTQSLIQKINPKDEAQKLAGIKSLMHTSAHAANFAGAGTESARSLNAFKNYGTKELLNQQSLKKMFKTIKTPEEWGKVLEYMKQIEPGDTKGFMAYLEGLKKTNLDRLQDAAYFIWVHAKLSSPKSHVKNILGSTFSTLSAPLEQGLAGMSQGARALVSKNVVRDRFVGEAPARAIGTMMGFKDALRSSLHTMKTGLSEFAGEKYSTGFINPIPGKVGKAIESAGKSLKAEDEFFKILNMRGSMYSLAYRKASQEKLRGSAFTSRMAELISKPTNAMLELAQEEARYRTYTKDLGVTGKSFQNLLHNTPVLKYVVPFFKTPVNSAKYSLERTPFGVLQLAKAKNRIGGQVDDTLARAFYGSAPIVGGLALGAKAINDIRTGKVTRPASQPDAKDLTMASLIGGGLAQAFAEGSITGAVPVNPQDRLVFYAARKQPYSVLINGTYHSYLIEPLGTILGLTADALGAWDKISNEDAAEGIAIGISKNFADKSFMQGVSSLFDAWGDSERHGQRFINGLATGFVPFSELGRTINKSIDPTMRRPETIGDAFRSVIPGLSINIPPIYDLWGERVTSEQGPIESIFNPLRRSTRSTDKATQEVERLGIQPGSIKRVTGNIKLESVVYQIAQQERGKLAKKLVDQQVNSPDWGSIPDLKKEMRLNKAFDEATEETRKMLGITAKSKAAKDLVMGIELATQENDKAREQELRAQLQRILDEKIFSLKGKQP